jgi:phenylalanyl-tRNA synthetase beta chain
MIIPLIWLKDYIHTSKSPKELAKAFTEIGLMLDRPIYGEVLDLEHRMDRSDWLSITGCARDIAAFEDLKLHFPKLNSTKLPKTDEVYVQVRSNKVNRFKTRVIKNVKVGESPDFIKQRLEAYGLPVINNIVDITNFVMVEMGQPLHAQDLAKFEKREIILRDTKENEVIQTLDSSIMKLKENTLVLSENNNPICIGGIVGGLRTGVTETTTEIVLDSGNYDQAAIRKTSREVGIRNETVLRSEKFLSPELVDLAIVRATDLILEYAGGEAFENSDFEKEKYHPKIMTLHKERLDLISGETNYFEKAEKILEALDYEIIENKDNKIKVQVPFFRTDVEVEDDLVADVIRISGYSQIKPKPINNYPPRELTPEILKLETRLVDLLISAGFHEHITDPIVKYDGISHRILLQNSVNSEKDSLRVSIRETLNPVLKNYQKHGKNEIKLFEIGNNYFKNNLELVEEKSLGIIFETGDSLSNSQNIRKIIDNLMSNLNIDYYFKKSAKHVSIFSGEKEIGYFSGNFTELNVAKLLELTTFKPYVQTELENLSKEDLTFITHIDYESGEIIEFIRNISPLVSKLEFIGEYLDGSNRKVTVRFYTAYPSESKNIREEIIGNSSKKFNISFSS